MCGIVYSRSLIGKPVNNTIFKRYKAQRGRGTDGFGFYLPQENRLTHNTREGRILRLLKRQKSEEIMFHHRLPTSTLNVRNSCHPFSTKDYFKNNYVLIHNGIIWNDEELLKKHHNFGIEYVSEEPDGSFNDSEALLYEVAMFIEGWQDKIEAQGSMAFIVAKRNKKGEPLGIYFGRNYGNPLKLKHTAFSLTLSSEGKGVDVEAHKLHYYDYKTDKITSQECIFPSSSYAYNGDNYYQGMGFGYAQNPNMDDDDELGHLLQGSKNSEELDRTLRHYDATQSENNRIRRVKDKLLYDNFENPYDAVLSGEAKISKLQARELVLKNSVEAEIASDEDTDEYLALPDEIYYYQQAIKELEREATAQREQEFFRSAPRVTRTAIDSPSHTRGSSVH